MSCHSSYVREAYVDTCLFHVINIIQCHNFNIMLSLCFDDTNVIN